MSARVYLNFHGVGEPHSGVDADERPYWVTPERLAEILALVAPRAPQIGITFDDGNLSDVTLALPALKQAGVSATFFMLTDRIGAPLYVSADNIRMLHKQGMRIGSHGVAHTDWTTLSDERLEDEIVRSLAILSDIVGAPVRCVGVPFGAYDGRVLRMLRRKGVEQVFTSDGGPSLSGAWLIPRTSVRSDMPLSAIEAIPNDAAVYYMRAAKRVGRRMLTSLAGRT